MSAGPGVRSFAQAALVVCLALLFILTVQSLVENGRAERSLARVKSDLDASLRRNRELERLLVLATNRATAEGTLADWGYRRSNDVLVDLRIPPAPESSPSDRPAFTSAALIIGLFSAAGLAFAWLRWGDRFPSLPAVFARRRSAVPSRRDEGREEDPPS